MASTTRSTSEVLHDHLRRRKDGDLEGDIETNYSPDVVLLSAEGVHRGHDGVRTLASVLHSYARDARYEYDQVVCDGEVGLLNWSGDSESVRIRDGADSYVVRDGRIVAQTIHFSVDGG